MSVPYKRIPRDQWKTRVIKLTVQQRADICTAYQAGASERALAAAYGVRRYTIHYHLKKAGVPPHPVGGWHR